MPIRVNLSQSRQTKRSGAALLRRRLVFFGLLLAITAGLIALGWNALGAHPFVPIRLLLFSCLVVNAPWLALSGATALTGFFIRVLARDSVAAVLRVTPDPGPLTLRIALAVCTRDEAPEPIAARLDRLLREAAEAGVADRVRACLLSDTSSDTIAARERVAMEALARAHGADRVMWRRRAGNDGFKAGNLMSFFDENWQEFDAALVLDADSDMRWAAISRLAAIMQADPETAIMQAIFGADPAVRGTIFSRLVQFGGEPGMRIWATGQAWWQDADGPYWGHNALLRIAPFRAHCRLPTLPGGAAILSHDHVEAARLHAAGWAVRVLPGADGSMEGAPPSLPAMLARDARWAAGNLQYRFLLRASDLSQIGRAQMAQALAHYALTPFWCALLPLSILAVATGEARAIPRGPLLWLLFAGYSCLHGPRLLGHFDQILSVRGGRIAYAWRAAREIVFSVLLDPVFAVRKTRVIVAALLGAGKTPLWATQDRDGSVLPPAVAARLFAVETALGVAGLAILLAFGSPFAVGLGAVALAGLILAAPLAAVTSSRGG